MKKIISSLLCIGMITVLLAGCGYNNALEQNKETTQPATQSAEADNGKKIKASDYKDSLDGLAQYFAAKGYIATNKDGKIEDKNVTVMDASLIGAKEGKKYQTGNNIFIEFYSYDTKKLNDKAEGVIKSVKDNGTFTILDLQPVTAYISDNGKYLMVYTDTTIKADNPDKSAVNYTTRENAIEDFKAFHAK